MSKYVYGHRAEDFGEHRATAFEHEAKHCVTDASSQGVSIAASSNRGDNVDALESRAALKLARAIRWRRDNEQVWRFMVSHAMSLAEKGQPIAVQSLIEQAREKRFVDRYGRDTRINNDFAPIFARWLAREHPEMVPLIERRRSVFDSLVVCDG